MQQENLMNLEEGVQGDNLINLEEESRGRRKQ